ncbi:MAG TPA: (5-formylfuran-3-yl)methyl phosphate synthase [Methanotrichaceae archaeon]|nr:(5-formylfuran-3-yl)methyl phosphate synthase [Methanotrichaceae archaeon]HQI92142.1 (5-formylfuran-3-yl)methyl phosphate synthase [Methanotrichaceae archaeon]
MRLLVSPMSLEEAWAALQGGADILDVKNPREGSLGANFPWAIREVAAMAAGRVPVSATIGDLPFKPGTASLAALGAAISGADYVKAGLLGVRTADEAEEMMAAIVRAVREVDGRKKVVACAYSDFQRAGSLDPMQLAGPAKRAGSDLIMVDTAVKDGRSTFEFMTEDDLSGFVKAGHKGGMEVALAGTIGFEHIGMLKDIAPDIIGVRGVVCGGDRQTCIKAELVRELKDRLI